MAAEWVSGSPLSSSQMIEVESKFRVPPDFEKVLKLKGAKLMPQTTFTDVYFDAPNHELSLNGHWLRKRNNKWELKIQKLKNERWIESNREIEDENEILNEIIKRLLSLYPNIGRDYKSVEDMVQGSSFKQIACFTTNRTVYKMPDGVVVDLDQASFGYQVGELEVLVSSEKSVEVAKELIQKTAELLEVIMNNLSNVDSL
ncbi:thiamine-triphosphatase-like isoform X2 [Stylophora pistillata]|uniref:thiamine-triphosphatase-like isoform X2 n=1 Tax=Stylophora pistillata TaxID=50429 RepID=UPI000C03B496|nr:thiamine-triphosphatase-like isoform X2 [Stylophora pistillata]